VAIRFSTGLRNNLAGTTGFAASFANGVIEIYTGTQPSSANNAVTGTLLGTVTLAGGAFTPGSPTNGLTFAAAADGSVSKSGVWSFVGIAAGTAGWFRLKANAVDTGLLSTTAVRMDGSIGTSGADLNISNINVAIGAPNTVDTFVYTQPAQ
jgi:hypothetical protein